MQSLRAFSSLGGFSAVLGFVYILLSTQSMTQKAVAAFLAALYTFLSAAMFLWPDYQGVFQRIIFGSYILWAFAALWSVQEA